MCTPIFNQKTGIFSFLISLVVIQTAFCVSPCQLILDGDLNRDCKVDMDDLSWFASFWMQNWSAQPGAFLPDGIYVAPPEQGSFDYPGCGSILEPCQTINYGINRADNSFKRYVFVADGTYQESVNLVNGINVWGGFNPVTWVRSKPFLRNTILSGPAAGSHMKTLIADTIRFSSTEVSGFKIKGAEATQAAGNSYAVWINNSDNDLVLKENDIYLRCGTDGIDGEDGIGGIDGPDGLAGIGASNSMGSVIAGGWVGESGSSGADATSGGKAGTAGGGVFGIFINNTVPTALGPSLIGNTIYAGRGGNGGDGGWGGIGPEPGVGGGGGGGGAGGIASSIYTRNLTTIPVYQDFNSFSGTNIGGNGGKGGKSFVNSGTDGVAGAALNYYYE